MTFLSLRGPMATIPHNLTHLDKVTTFYVLSSKVKYVPDLSAMKSLRGYSIYRNTDLVYVSKLDSPPPSICFVSLKDNTALASIPDFYDCRLTKLNLENTPLHCNVSLCWVRMWPWMKPELTMDDAICASPPELQDQRLMETNPVLMYCYEGKWDWQPCLYGALSWLDSSLLHKIS